MALPTQSVGDKTGIPSITAVDSDGLVYIRLGPIRLYFGTGTPNGTVTGGGPGGVGSLFIEIGTGAIYQCTGTTVWTVVTQT